jgi:hypothetical protein
MIAIARMALTMVARIMAGRLIIACIQVERVSGRGGDGAKTAVQTGRQGERLVA